MISNISSQDLKAKFENINQNKITVKADIFKNKIADGINTESNITVSKGSIESSKTGNNSYQSKISGKTVSNIHSLINDKASEGNVKVKANVFKDKILAFSNDNMAIDTRISKISKVNPNLISFTTKKIDLPETLNPEIGSNDYIKNNLDKVTDKIKDDIKTGGGTQGVSLPTADIYALNDAFNNVQKLQLYSTKGLEKVEDIIGKVIEGKTLSLSELADLKKFSDLTIANADKLGVNKATFEKLNSLITGVQKSSENLEVKTEEFNKNAELVNKKLDALVAAVSDPKLNLDSNFVEMLNILRQRYKGIISSANPAMINMFSAYMDKVMQTIQDVKDGKERDPGIFRKLQNDYDKFSENLFNAMGQGKLPPDAEIKAYMGELSESFIDMVKTHVMPSISSGQGSSNLASSSGKVNSNPALPAMRKLMQFTPEESSVMSKVSLNSVRKAMSIDKVENAFSDISSSIKSLKMSAIDVFSAKKQLEESMSQLRKLLSSNEFKSSFSEIKNLSGGDSLTKVLADEIRAAIARAEELEAKLNLEIDNSDAPGIIDLLIKFREIITQLDIDLRKVKDKEERTKGIDKDFLKSTNDIQTRKDSLDKMRDESLKKVLKSVKEKFALNK